MIAPEMADVRRMEKRGNWISTGMAGRMRSGRFTRMCW